jgi:D-arabinose 5-phosphate isomerase GutQ
MSVSVLSVFIGVNTYTTAGRECGWAVQVTGLVEAAHNNAAPTKSTMLMEVFSMEMKWLLQRKTQVIGEHNT